MARVLRPVVVAWNLAREVAGSRRTRAGVAIVAALVLIAPAHAVSGQSGGAVRIRVLSNRADLISGGDAYFRILLPGDASADGLRVTAGGRDVSGGFARR